MSPPPWFNQGLRFSCTQCGNCCTGPPGFVRFTQAEANAIAKYLNLTLEDFKSRCTHTNYGFESLKEQHTSHGYDCIFLERDSQGKALCKIYPVRPLQCRTWPFWPENLDQPDDWLTAAQNCPGMSNGKLYSPDQIRIIRDSHTTP